MIIFPQASVINSSGVYTTVYGEAIIFYQIMPQEDANNSDSGKRFLLYKPLKNVKENLSVALSGVWGSDSDIEVLNIKDIVDIVGIWKGPHTESIYIIRKHPALEMLPEEERGVSKENEPEDDEENDVGV